MLRTSAMALGYGPLSSAAATETWDYHIDFSRGDDDHDGTAPDRAFKTPAPLSRLSRLRGKRIGIAGGSYFDGDICDPRLYRDEDKIEIGIYGPDVWAYFDCTAIARGWTATEFSKVVWKARVSFSTSEAKNSGNVFYRGRPLQLVRTPAEVADAGPGHACVEEWFAFEPVSEAWLYVHSDNDPGSQIRYSRHGHGIRLREDDAAVSDVVVSGSLHQDGGLVSFGLRSRWRRIGANYGSRHNALIGPDFVVSDSRFVGGSNAQEMSANHLVCFATELEGKQGALDGCLFDADGERTEAFLSHDVTGKGSLSEVTFAECDFSGLSEGVVGTAATVLNLMDCTCAGASHLITEGAGGKTVNIKRSRGWTTGLVNCNHPEGDFVVNTTGCNFLIGDRQAGQRYAIHSQGTGRTIWSSDGDTLTGLSATAVSRIKSGEIHRSSTRIDGRWEEVDILGFDGGAGDFIGGGNTYLTKGGWELNGERFASFDQWRATGRDSGSVG